jgi:hypothetical protein
MQGTKRKLSDSDITIDPIVPIESKENVESKESKENTEPKGSVIDPETYTVLSPSIVIPAEENKRLELVWQSILAKPNLSRKYTQESNRIHSEKTTDPPSVDGLMKKPKKRVALLLSYAGTGYQGMQM